MRILILSDIHANRSALEKVLSDAGQYDLLLCAGDITGYCRDVNCVFDILLSLENCLMIKGNHDDYLLKNNFIHPNPIVNKSVAYTHEHITKDNLKVIEHLESSLTIMAGGQTIFMVHGSPWDPLREYIYPDSERIEQLIQIPGDIIIMGHTHYPFIRHVGSKIVINPGSTAQPRGPHKNSSYVTLDTKTRNAKIHTITEVKHLEGKAIAFA